MIEPAQREHRDVPLANTFGITAHARRLIDVVDVDALPAALADAGQDSLLLGSGSNLLIVAPHVDAVVHVSDDRIDLIDKLVPVYEEILSKLADAGAEYVQIDEPFLALDIDEKVQSLYKSVRAVKNNYVHQVQNIAFQQKGRKPCL